METKMLSQLENLDYFIYNRFLTVEKNVCSGSNSFYDSFLDLFETTFKYILEENDIIFDNSRTVGYIIRTKSIEDYFISKFKYPKTFYDKITDYIKKCNDHKHKKEKNIQIYGIVSFLKFYFEFLNIYLESKKIDKITFDEDYINNSYLLFEKINNNLKSELDSLKNELKSSYNENKLSQENMVKYQQIIQENKLSLKEIEFENIQLQHQIDVLKDIKMNSLETKLNKTLDLLLNLTDNVKENRVAIGVVYTSITGRNLIEDINKLNK